MISMNKLSSQIETIKKSVNESKCELEVRTFNCENGYVL